jgi:methionyl-tRNA formyltransferase
MKISLIFADTLRSKEYFKHLIKNNIKPYKVFLYSDKKKHTLEKFIKNNGVEVKFFRSKNINNIKIFNEIRRTVSRYFVYSGYPGEIVKKNLLRIKNIIHLHSGLLPNFKGSTTMYYSLLLTNKIYCTCLKLNQKIDEGKIMYIQKFKKPNNLKLLEGKYDNEIRAKTLVNFLIKGKKKIYMQKNNKYESYYIAHPIIRNLVISKKKLNTLI